MLAFTLVLHIFFYYQINRFIYRILAIISRSWIEATPKGLFVMFWDDFRIEAAPKSQKINIRAAYNSKNAVIYDLLLSDYFNNYSWINLHNYACPYSWTHFFPNIRIHKHVWILMKTKIWGRQIFSLCSTIL